MSEDLKITIDAADDSVRQAMAKMQFMMGDMAPLMQKIAGRMHEAVEENFEREGRPRWTDLSKSTQDRRTRKGTWPGKILQARGRLAASIAVRHDATTAMVGTNLPYARAHQFGVNKDVAIKQHASRRRYDRNAVEWVRVGAHTRRMRLPARPFLAMQGQDYLAILVLVQAHIKLGTTV